MQSEKNRWFGILQEWFTKNLTTKYEFQAQRYAYQKYYEIIKKIYLDNVEKFNEKQEEIAFKGFEEAREADKEHTRLRKATEKFDYRRTPVTPEEIETYRAHHNAYKKKQQMYRLIGPDSEFYKNYPFVIWDRLKKLSEENPTINAIKQRVKFLEDDDNPTKIWWSFVNIHSYVFFIKSTPKIKRNIKIIEDTIEFIREVPYYFQIVSPESVNNNEKRLEEILLGKFYKFWRKGNNVTYSDILSGKNKFQDLIYEVEFIKDQYLPFYYLIRSLSDDDEEEEEEEEITHISEKKLPQKPSDIKEEKIINKSDIKEEAKNIDEIISHHTIKKSDIQEEEEEEEEQNIPIIKKNEKKSIINKYLPIFLVFAVVLLFLQLLSNKIRL